MAKHIVGGELYHRLDGKLFEIKRQLRQPSGYPHDPEMLSYHLQELIEGRFESPSFFRGTGELCMQVPAIARPTLRQLQERYPEIEIESIVRDNSTEKPMTLSLGTVLLHGDSGSINFEEYKKRITPQRASVGGIQQLRWLVQHQKECPALMALLGKIYIDFPAIVVASRGMCYSPYCNQGGLLWVDRWFWLGYGFNSLGRIAFGR